MLGKIYWSRKRRWSAWKMQQGDTWLSLSCRLLTMEHLQNPPSQLFRASSKDIFVKYVLYSWWFTWVSGTLHCITHSNIKDKFFKSTYFTSTWQMTISIFFVGIFASESLYKWYKWKYYDGKTWICQIIDLSLSTTDDKRIVLNTFKHKSNEN